MNSIQEAAAQARKYAHGSYLHQEAMSYLFKAYRDAHLSPFGFITLDTLWSWVDIQVNPRCNTRRVYGPNGATFRN